MNRRTRGAWCVWAVIITGLAGAATILPSESASASESEADGMRLVASDGSMRAVILLPGDADELERDAGDELAGHLAMIGDGSPRVVRVSVEEMRARAAELRDDGAAPIMLAASLHPSPLPGRHRGHGEAFALDVAEGIAHVAGASPRGTLHGTYELLEQIGFRWFMPGDLGRTLPLDNDTPALAEQRTVQAPSFRGRTVREDRDWRRRNRLGGTAPPANLNMPSLGELEDHPERYALVGGERHDGQLCVSNPETLEAMIDLARDRFNDAPERRWLALGTHGGAHCECDDCRALDPPGEFGPFTDGINVTDRYIRFANGVLEAIGEEFPEKRISLQFASGHLLPPVNARGHANLDIIAWTVGYCRIHGAGNPVCGERMMVGERTATWLERIDGRYYERTSWGNVAGPGLLFPLVHRYRRELPLYREHGVSGFRIAPYSNWISENPSAYIAARLTWDHEADVEAMLDDFYRRYYGPAATVMGRYHELVEDAAAHADHHTGTAMDAPHIYTAEVRAEARAHVNDALALTDGGLHERRIEKVVLALDYLDAFIEMIEHRNRHDYAQAVASLDRAHQLNEQLREDYEFPLLTERSAGYLDRFFGNAVRAAHQRTSEKGERVAVLDDQWDFQIDPERIGEEMGLHRPATTGGNWQTIRAWSSSWSNQGIRYYRGDAWYRQSVHVPERFADRTVKLWVGGVDERARVWVNGVKLGDSPVGAFRSFELDATGAIEPGQSNLVVIRAGNHQTQEVGTGGLLAPVMLWAPHE